MFKHLKRLFCQHPQSMRKFVMPVRDKVNNHIGNIYCCRMCGKRFYKDEVIG